jgi:crotonobetainyl-CoA:carnitine CoA-transferase CaiB-like acyl-CoA transferase
MSSPLEGIRVIDLAQMWAAPAAAMYLADQGAEVIKVEPLWGDDARRTFTLPPLPSGESRAFLPLNRNKLGICVDIRHPAGREIIYRLVRTADVVVHNFRPGVAERLGYDYPTLKALNPRLIYGWLTGYGPEGPYARRGSYDLIIQAISGVLARRRRPDGMPISSGIWVADMSAAMLLAYGITLALLARERTGEGTIVQTSLLQAALAMQFVDLVEVEREVRPERPVDFSAQAMYAPYRCADGLYLILVVVQDAQWRRLCQVLGVPELADEPRFATALGRAQNSAELYDIVAALFETRPRDEWIAELQAADVPCAPILSPFEALHQPQVEVNRMVIDLDDPVAGRTRMVGTPVRLIGAPEIGHRRAPLPGEHTRRVLLDLGYTEAEISALEAENIIRCRRSADDVS